MEERKRRSKFVLLPVNTCFRTSLDWSPSHSVRRRMSDIQLIRPIADYAQLSVPTPLRPLPVAGTTLREDSCVYSLLQLPDNFLLRDFYDEKIHYNRMPVSRVDRERERERHQLLLCPDSWMERTFDWTRSLP